MQAVVAFLFALIFVVFSIFCIREVWKGRSSADSNFYFFMAILGILCTLLMSIAAGSMSVDNRWAEHRDCESGVTEIGHTVITDCDAYYDAPKAE